MVVIVCFPFDDASRHKYHSIFVTLWMSTRKERRLCFQMRFGGACDVTQRGTPCLARALKSPVSCYWTAVFVSTRIMILNWFTRDSFRETSMLRLFTYAYLHVRVYTCASIDRHYLFAERDRSTLVGCVSPKQIPVCLRLDIKMWRGKRKKWPQRVCVFFFVYVMR